MKSFDSKFGKAFFSTLPTTPGVYRYYGASEAPIYIGKAKNLRRRLGQYRNAKRCKKNAKMRTIVREASRLEFEVFESHEKACLEETRLIQELRPKWNVEGAFFFLYPLIGFEAVGDEWRFCYTSCPEDHAGLELFGAFRSREIAGEAFFSLMKLLRYVGHQTGKPIRDKKSYLYRFRRIPPEWVPLFSSFLRGRDRNFMETLLLALVENADARSRGAEVQEHLNALTRFWRHEARRLDRVIQKLKHVSYPVSQRERDVLFLRSRLMNSELTVSGGDQSRNTGIAPGREVGPQR